MNSRSQTGMGGKIYKEGMKITYSGPGLMISLEDKIKKDTEYL